MKIKGIAGGRHDSLKKGDIISLSPEEKIIAMAKEQVSENSPVGLRRIPLKAEVIGEVQTVKGRSLKNNGDPTQYIGTAKVHYRTLRLSDDRIMPAKTITVKIHCKDCKDDIGVEDLETLDYKVLKES